MRPRLKAIVATVYVSFLCAVSTVMHRLKTFSEIDLVHLAKSKIPVFVQIPECRAIMHMQFYTSLFA